VTDASSKYWMKPFNGDNEFIGVGKNLSPSDCGLLLHDMAKSFRLMPVFQEDMWVPIVRTTQDHNHG
jgi:hypothetical protein